MESNMKPTNSKNRDEITTTEDFPVDYSWNTIELVAITVLKNRGMLDHSSWRDAKIYILRSCLRNDIIHVFYPKIESLIKDHVSAIAQNLPDKDMPLETFCHAWRDYKVASEEFQAFFAPYNYTILTENRKISRDPTEKRASYLKIDELTKYAWKKNILEKRGSEITSLLWNTIEIERNEAPFVQEVVESFEQVDAVDVFENTIFKKLEEFYTSKSKEWFQGLNVTEFIEKVLQTMQGEVGWCRKFLPERSIGKMRSIFIEKATMERMDEMIKTCQQMVMENREDEMKNVYKILRLLPAEVQSQLYSL